MKRLIYSVLAAVVGAGLAMGVAPASGAAVSPVTIDFSVLPSGPFDPHTFDAKGVYFSGDDWAVGLIQGFNALSAWSFPNSPVEANFPQGISEMSVSLAPSLQGTATFSLRAFSRTGDLVGLAQRTITVDEGDPDHMGWGYWDISLAALSRPAVRVVIDSTFVRSSWGNPLIPYGVRTITFAPVAAAAELSALVTLVESFDIRALGTSLTDKLMDVRASLEAGMPAKAIETLNAFIHQVEAQSGKHLSVGQANALIAGAEAVKDAIP